MLRHRWHETLQRCADRPAIFQGDAVLRFTDLADSLARLPPATSPVLACGKPLDIVLATLRGWRDDRPVLPVERPDADIPDLDGLPPEVAHLKLTPGNDGRPRAVLFTAAQIAADADRLVAAMGLDDAVPNLATLSLAHSYGYSSIILPLLLHGIPIRTVEVPFPAVVSAAWQRHDAVVVPAVPSMWKAWLRSGILAGAPIRLAVSAGAPLPLELETAAWDAHRLKLHNFYGTTECGGISWDPSGTPRHDPGDLGEPLPGVEVSIGPGERLRVRSSSVALGYGSRRSEGRFADGAFLTPDVGRLENGRILLESSAGGHINVAGRKIGPARVENLLLATGLVAKVRVFGVPSHDPERVDEVAALVPPGTDLAALRSAVAERLAGWETPRQWFTDAAAWELSRTELRKRFSRRTG
jgi:acyl-coenzyme A synthetase/AMP-(fatty) acid ligase